MTDPLPAIDPSSCKESRRVAAYFAGRLLNKLRWNLQIGLFARYETGVAVDTFNELMAVSVCLSENGAMEFLGLVENQQNKWLSMRKEIHFAEDLDAARIKVDSCDFLEADTETDCIDDLMQRYADHVAEEVEQGFRKLTPTSDEIELTSLGKSVDMLVRPKGTAQLLSRASVVFAKRPSDPNGPALPLPIRSTLILRESPSTPNQSVTLGFIRGLACKLGIKSILMDSPGSDPNNTATQYDRLIREALKPEVASIESCSRTIPISKKDAAFILTCGEGRANPSEYIANRIKTGELDNPEGVGGKYCFNINNFPERHHSVLRGEGDMSVTQLVESLRKSRRSSNS